MLKIIIGIICILYFIKATKSIFSTKKIPLFEKDINEMIKNNAQDEYGKLLQIIIITIILLSAIFAGFLGIILFLFINHIIIILLTIIEIIIVIMSCFITVDILIGMQNDINNIIKFNTVSGSSIINIISSAYEMFYFLFVGLILILFPI